MTPREKAKEIVDKFAEQLYHLSYVTNGIEVYVYEQAINCALIAVDEILDIIDNMNEYDYRADYYWQEVKQEIEKL